MSQINLHKIIRQQQEQLVAMQVQIQALLVAQGEAGRGGEVGGGKASYLQWRSREGGRIHYSM